MLEIIIKKYNKTSVPKPKVCIVNVSSMLNFLIDSETEFSALPSYNYNEN